MLEIIVANLTSPAVLFFALGLLAARFRSDLKLPQGLSETLSIYLLIAIGLKGGIELSKYSLTDILAPLWGGVLIGCLIPPVTVFVLRRMGLDLNNAVALAATYGSVSIVTFGAGVAFLEKTGTPYEGYMSAVVALMEVPAIMIALLMLKSLSAPRTELSQTVTLNSQILPIPRHWIDPHVLRECLFSKSVLLLLGSLVIGFISGEEALPIVKPLFVDLYRGFLLLFLLGMGVVCGQQLGELRSKGAKLLLFAVLAPLVYGTFGVLVGTAVGLSLGGTMLMGVLAASASYIAAPAALRTSVPDANPSIYLGLALGVTFPFNLVLGLPIYYFIATTLS